jgi:hypothetical protein
MTWSVGLSNLPLEDDSGMTFGERVSRLAAKELQRNNDSGAEAKDRREKLADIRKTFGERAAALVEADSQRDDAQAATIKAKHDQLAVVAKLVDDATKALVSTHAAHLPARPMRAAVRLYGLANVDGSAVGARIGLEVLLDDAPLAPVLVESKAPIGR